MKIIDTFNKTLKHIETLHNDYKETLVLFKDNKYMHIPNMLTITRLLLVPVIALLFLLNSPIILVIVSAFASATDFLDGAISRKMGANNAFGKKLDPLADKFLAGILLIINSITFPMFIVSILLEFMITKINMEALSENKKARTNQRGRIKTVVLYITLLIGLLDKLVPALKPVTMMGFLLSTFMQTSTIKSYVNDYYIEEEVKEFKENNIEHKEVPKSNKPEKELLKDYRNSLLYKEEEQKEKTLI